MSLSEAAAERIRPDTYLLTVTDDLTEQEVYDIARHLTLTKGWWVVIEDRNGMVRPYQQGPA